MYIKIGLENGIEGRSLVWVLDHDLLLVPRPLVPAVQALIRDYRQPDRGEPDEGERPLYAGYDDEQGPDAS